MRRKAFLLALTLINTILAFNLLWPIEKIDPKLKPYYDDLMDLSKSYCYKYEINSFNQTIIKFDDLEEDSIGKCSRRIGDLRAEIIIDRNFWENASPKERSILFSHEYMHCFHNAEHSDFPKHFMNDYIPDDLNAFIFVFQYVQILQESCTKWRTKL